MDQLTTAPVLIAGVFMPQPGVDDSRPLYWPDGEKPPERQAVYYAFLGLMVGGFVAGCALHTIWMILGLASMFGLIVFHQWNGRGTAKRLAEQLARRVSFPAEAWGSGERAEFAAAVGRVVAEEIGWPNWHFLPEDPLEAIFYCPGGDGGEGMVIFVKFEKTFGRRCVFPAGETFGEFVDRNLAPWAARGTGVG